MLGLKEKIVDVEIVFVYGKIEEKTMECPPGMTDAEEDDVLVLNEGLVHAARHYHKKVVEILHKIVFNGGEFHPCLFWKQYEKDIVFVT